MPAERKPPACVDHRMPTNIYWLDEPLMMATSERRAKHIVARLNALAATGKVEAQGLVNAIRELNGMVEYLVISGAEHAVTE